MFCLSKGLCCPVGSLLVGTAEFIEKARKVRKILGGGMRQAGIIAAPGIIALKGMVERLSEDHRNARLLAEGIYKNEKLEIDLSRVETNIVCFDISGLGIAIELFISKLRKKGILALAMNKDNVRMVTHNGIEREHVEKTIEAINDVTSEAESD